MFAEEDQLLIKLRTGIDQPLADICNDHEKYFLLKYVTFQYKYCDPWEGDEIVLLSVANFSLTVISYIYFSSPHLTCVVG